MQTICLQFLQILIGTTFYLNPKENYHVELEPHLEIVESFLENEYQIETKLIKMNSQIETILVNNILPWSCVLKM